MMREPAETGMRASPGDLGRDQAQRFCFARFADRAAFLSLGNIISAISNTLVFLRYSNCFDCCATHRHPGGHGPSSAQWPKPKEHWHSITGSSKATHRSYRETCSTERTNRTPPPTPRWVFTSFFRASALSWPRNPGQLNKLGNLHALVRPIATDEPHANRRHCYLP